MKIDGPLIQGKFIERPNRFIVIAKVEGKIMRTHLPDPGRLKELLFPGAKLLLRHAPKNSKRKTKYTTVMVNHGGQLISLVSTLPNHLVSELLQNKELPMLSEYNYVQSEVLNGSHRFDFLLNDQNKTPFFLEVKSVTYVENGLAKFPDAITLRGKRHAHALTKLVQKGAGAGILFVCQRPDAKQFAPMWNRDPKFAEALLHAKKSGVKVWCITTKISETDISFKNQIPVNLFPPD